MKQSGGYLGRLLDPWLKTALPLIKNVIKPLAKRINWAESEADAGIHKKVLGSGRRHYSSALNNFPSSATLIISNNEVEGIIKIVKSLEDSGL